MTKSTLEQFGALVEAVIGSQLNLRAFGNPTDRTLISPAERRLVVERALRRAAYMLALRLYLRLPLLYAEEFVLQSRIALLRLRSFLRSHLN